MININESVPRKLSGISSLFITFNFNQDVIDIIKQSDKYIYDKNDHSWEVPCTSLCSLLDRLTYVDDITLTLLKDDKEEIHYYPKLTHEYSPFKHQQEGIEFGLNTPRWLLLDEPGAGKTLQMIYLAEELKEQKGLEHCFIICGVNAAKPNWKAEINKFSTLSCRVLGEKKTKKGKIYYAPIKDRAAELMQPLKDFFIITNIETLRDKDIIQALLTTKNKIDMIVVDECHRIKDPNAKQSANLMKLKNYTYKIGLTGTLIMNNPIDAYTSLKWIGVEKSNFTNFKNTYCIFGGFGNHEITGYKNIEMLKEELQTYSLRRTRDQFSDLPPRTVIREVIEMDNQHKEFYENVVNGVKDECNKVLLNPTNTLALTTRLRQATSCPSVLTTNPIKSTKIERCIELAEDIIANNNKVVIMTVFKEPANELFRKLKKYNPLLGTGDLKDDEVTQNIALFQEDPKYKVFIGTASKCGTAINLNAAYYMICIETPWTYALQDQVESRIDRVNNKQPAFIYRLICQDTIDEVVDKLLDTKQAFSDFVVDDKLSDDSLQILKDYIEDL